jgi:hypothetical protein
MTLIKSKINSLAWLKSAIYVSVIGGGVLSFFTPVLAAKITYDYEDATSLILLVNQYTFGEGESPLYYDGYYWKSTINIKENNGSASDDLVVRVYLQHIRNPQTGESDSGGSLNLDFRSASSTGWTFEYDNDRSGHPGGKQLDLVSGTLAVKKFKSSTTTGTTTGITDWNLIVNAKHVPEPTTIFGTALALGWGGWLKRKNLIKQDKTKSRG